MGPDQWIALAALVLSVVIPICGVIYRLGQVASDVRELTRRVGRIEDKLDNRRLARGRD